MTDRDRVSAELRLGLYLIPSHMHEAIRLYVLEGDKPGGFLQALLSNDLIMAFTKADVENSFAMSGWARYLISHCPAACFGSPEAYENWSGI